MLLLLLVAFVGIVASNDIQRISEIQIVKPGSEAVLSCITSQPYSTCSWTLPSGAQCTSMRPNVTTMCRASSDVHYVGSSNDCQILVKNIKSDHDGNWTCGILTETERKQMSTQLVVLHQASVDFKDVYGDLTIKSGQPLQLVCEAEHTRPIGEFLWHFGDGREEADRIPNSEPIITTLTDINTGIATATQQLLLEASPENHGKTINCTYNQVNHRGEVLLSSSATIGLDVIYMELDPVRSLVPFATSGTSLNLSTTFKAHPKPEDKAVLWRIEETRGTIILHAGQAPGRTQDYIAHPLQLLSENSYAAVLTITNVSLADNDKKFKVSINSSMNQLEEQEFRVSVDRPWPNDDNTPSQSDPTTAIIIIVVIVLLIIIIIITVVLVLYAKKNQKWCYQNTSPYVSPEIEAQKKPLKTEEPPIVKNHPYGRPST